MDQRANPPFVSIIIDNYNYARFLRAAIDSALAQSYGACEVLVVDDGSTDQSREVIAEYGDRIRAILKPNGGQASAFNAGFAHSRGDIVLFLDSDDMLLPDTVARVVERFQAHPECAFIQFRLSVVDAEGNPTGVSMPPAHIRQPNGDLRLCLQQLISNVWWSPTSGNAFASWVLQRIFPVPETMFRIDADFYLSRAAALCGPMLSLDDIGALYRVHRTNNFYTTALNVEKFQKHVRQIHDAHPILKQLADSLNISAYPQQALDIPDTMFLTGRLMSLKLAPARHPIPDDKLQAIIWRGAAVVLQRTDTPWLYKVTHALWFVIMPVLPYRFAYWLTEILFIPDVRRQLFRQFNKALSR